MESGFRNWTPDAITLTGTASNFRGPAGLTYSILDASADWGTIAAAGGIADCFQATGDCYRFSLTGTRPAVQHVDTAFDETLSYNGFTRTAALHVGGSFPDVPTNNLFYPFVENLLHNGVTGGCAGGGYCPGSNVTRAQMAVFLLKARWGSVFLPPPATGTVFPDVPASNPFARWIEELSREGVTRGCGGGLYCPDNPVTRQQMAVFLLKTHRGPPMRRTRAAETSTTSLARDSSPTGSRISPAAHHRRLLGDSPALLPAEFRASAADGGVSREDLRTPALLTFGILSRFGAHVIRSTPEDCRMRIRAPLVAPAVYGIPTGADGGIVSNSSGGAMRASLLGACVLAIGVGPAAFAAQIPDITTTPSHTFTLICSPTPIATPTPTQTPPPSGMPAHTPVPAVGSQISVNTTTGGNQFFPAVAIGADEGFIVTWTSDAQDGDDSAIIGLRFDKTGAPLGGEFQGQVERFDDRLPVPLRDRLRPCGNLSSSGR